MRIVHWLFVVSAALFVSGLAVIIARERAARRAPAPPPPVATAAPVASVKQIMNGIVQPATNVLFTAVTTEVTAKGTVEKAPHTDQEWEAVGNSAAALIESGNLMLIGN